MRVELVRPPHVDAVWPAIAGGLQEAIDRTGGDISVGYLWNEVAGFRAWLLVVEHEGKILGASVWRCETWATGNKLRCLALYGHGAEDWSPEFNAAVYSLKSGTGSQSIVFEGRDGWSRSPHLRGRKVRKLRSTFELMD